nr:vegetative cell wall protein gp1-like [Paramormyrops kingsleyae]
MATPAARGERAAGGPRRPRLIGPGQPELDPPTRGYPAQRSALTGGSALQPSAARRHGDRKAAPAARLHRGNPASTYLSRPAKEEKALPAVLPAAATMPVSPILSALPCLPSAAPEAPAMALPPPMPEVLPISPARPILPAACLLVPSVSPAARLPAVVLPEVPTPAVPAPPVSAPPEAPRPPPPAPPEAPTLTPEISVPEEVPDCITIAPPPFLVLFPWSRPPLPLGAPRMTNTVNTTWYLSLAISDFLFCLFLPIKTCEYVATQN